VDDLDRLFRHLVRQLAESAPDRLPRPMQVSELYQRVLPYRVHRQALGFDAIEDYEMAMLRLLAGDRGYATVTPPDVQAELSEELKAVNPNTGLFRDYAAATVTLAQERVRQVLQEHESYAPPVSDDATVSVAGVAVQPAMEPPPAVEQAVAPLPVPGAPPGLRFTLEVEEQAAMQDGPRCPGCDATLPMRRSVAFCPFCGRRLSTVSCPECGAQVELAWRFCVACGHRMNGPA
jgi:hypothetical protein